MSKKKPYNGRDYLLLKIIGGATKAGVEPDRKKEANKKASRGPKMSRPVNSSQQNLMQLQELKHLKATLVIKEQRIKQLEDQLATAINKIRDAEGPVTIKGEILKLLEGEE